jgi:L-aspartate oxidase
VVHAGGAATGQRIVRQLAALVAREERIEVLEGRRATALLTSGEGRCVGVALDGGIDTISAGATVLATGGAAALWARTTNPRGAVGGGLLLAHRAGAALADLELMQFHPTAVVGSNGADGLLVTEAVRGEGARLLDANGKRFVDELAPRDEVARAVLGQLRASGARAVSLDMRHLDPALFPSVVAALRDAGIDPERELVPVAPAAHYMMGGVATDLCARSSVAGLYAVGECSDTGLHGANRLASNSLTECFVFGARAARDALAQPGPASDADAGAASDADAGAAAADLGSPARLPHAGPGRLAQPPPPPLSEASREALWRCAGLERDAEKLRSLLADEHPLVRLIARSALHRQESRGAHWRSDFPAVNPELDGCHVILAGDDQAPRYELWR